MKCLSIKGDQNTPNVILCVSEGLVEIAGRSAPRDSFEFYQPIMDWLDEYAKAPKPETNVKIYFTFFDTGTSRCFIHVLLRLQNIHKINQSVTVYWFYENDDVDMLDAGYDFESVAKIPFKMIEVQNDD